MAIHAHCQLLNFLNGLNFHIWFATQRISRGLPHKGSHVVCHTKDLTWFATQRISLGLPHKEKNP